MARPKHHPDRAVAYLRRSTARQDVSLDAQRQAIEAWAHRQGVQVVAWHEESISSRVHPLERPAFTDALLSLEVHKAGVLAVAKLDRVARKTTDYLLVEDDLRRSGRHIAFADGTSAEDSDEAQLLRTMLAAFAEFERKRISARTKAALRAKRALSQRTSRWPPFGFGFDPQDPKRLVPAPQERLALRRAGELRRQGLRYADIADVLNTEGRPHRGNGWTDRNVGRLLRQHPEGFLCCERAE